MSKKGGRLPGKTRSKRNDAIIKTVAAASRTRDRAYANGRGLPAAEHSTVRRPTAAEQVQPDIGRQMSVSRKQSSVRRQTAAREPEAGARREVAAQGEQPSVRRQTAAREPEAGARREVAAQGEQPSVRRPAVTQKERLKTRREAAAQGGQSSVRRSAAAQEARLNIRQQVAVREEQPGIDRQASASQLQPNARALISARPTQPDAGRPTSVSRPKLSSLLQSSALQRYVRLYNETETEQHSRALSDYIADPIHNERLTRRTERLRERDLLRGALPAGSETKAELLRVNESAGEVSVLLKLHVKRRMEQSGLFYMEERQECERLWLRQTGMEWQVLQVEPVISERRPRYGAAVHQTASEPEGTEEESEAHIASVPYLNYDLMPGFQHRKAGIPYRRDLAAAYADRWWDEGNPAYELFEVNCTHYVSQCIFAGNAPMNYTGKRESGWWYKGRTGGQERWSYSWAVSNALTQYLSTARKTGLRAVVVPSADQLQLGDVIAYDWTGDGRYQHSTIVTAFDSAGQPLVNANTVPSRHRYWDYRDSYAWTNGTKYRFFHIPDLL